MNCAHLCPNMEPFFLQNKLFPKPKISILRLAVFMLSVITLCNTRCTFHMSTIQQCYVEKVKRLKGVGVETLS